MQWTRSREVVVIKEVRVGAILILTSSVVLLCVRGTIDFDHGEIFGYAAMVLSFLMVFFGIRSYP